MLPHCSARHKIPAENLGNPIESAFPEETQEDLAIRHKPDGDFERLVTDLPPARQIMLIAVRAIHAPQMSHKFQFHDVGKR